LPTSIHILHAQPARIVATMTKISVATSEIPVILLKTRNTPNDGYEEYFNHTTPSAPSLETIRFKPTFIPVLEHTPNTENLRTIEALLTSGRLKDEYGGMIFTSQRAVEEWRDVVNKVESGTVRWPCAIYRSKLI
jgi:uroporphyrinogen-III synthase